MAQKFGIHLTADNKRLLFTIQHDHAGVQKIVVEESRWKSFVVSDCLHTDEADSNV